VVQEHANRNLVGIKPAESEGFQMLVDGIVKIDGSVAHEREDEQGVNSLADGGGLEPCCPPTSDVSRAKP